MLSEEKLFPDSRFVATNQNGNQELNLSVLTNLYLPLIGANAFSLYTFLFGVARSDQHTYRVHSFYEIQSSLSISLESIQSARKKLEAVDLMATFKTNESLFEFSVQLPLSSVEFLKTDLLTTLLLGTVGERTFKQLVGRVDAPREQTKQAENISASLLDVFSVPKSVIDQPSAEVASVKNQQITTNKLSANQQDLKEHPFDFDLLLEMLRTSFVDIESVKAAYNPIIAEHLLYDIDEINMSKLILKAVDLKTNQVDTKRLSLLVADKYGIGKRQTSSRVAQASSSQASKTDLSGFDSQIQQIITIAQKTAPIAFLNQIKKQKGGFVSSNEQRVIRDLVTRDILPAEVINILSYYVLVNLGNATLNKALAETIANDWAQHKVNTAPEAIKAIESRNEAKVNQKPQVRRNNGRHTVKETLPDWAKRNKDNKQQATTKTALTPEQEKLLDEKLKNLKKEK